MQREPCFSSQPQPSPFALTSTAPASALRELGALGGSRASPRGCNPRRWLEPAQERGAFQALSLSRGSVSHINRKSLALSSPPKSTPV